MAKVDPSTRLTRSPGSGATRATLAHGFTSGVFSSVGTGLALVTNRDEGGRVNHELRFAAA